MPGDSARPKAGTSGDLGRKTVTAIVATSRPVEKYGGVRLAPSALEQLRDKVRAGGLPMVNNHSATQPLDAGLLGAEIVALPDGEYALQATFEIGAGAWDRVEADWKRLGVPGGFSYTGTVFQERYGEGSASVVLAADAAAFSDEDRTAAGRRLAELGPVEVRRLFQFSTAEVARIALELLPDLLIGISSGIFGHLIIEAVGGLVGRRQEPSVVEIRIQEPDGAHKTAVIETNDPEIVRAGVEALDIVAAAEEPVQAFDPVKRLWLPPGARE